MLNSIKIKVILISIVVIVGVAVLYSQTASSDRASDAQIGNQEIQVQGVSLVNATEFSKLVGNEDAFLVDVHTPEQTHIPGTDAFIPFDDIGSYADRLPEDKDTPILVYCRSGNMSESASQEIYDLGYANVYDLDGGVKAYKGVNDEVSIYPDNQDLGIVIYGDVPTTTFILTNYTEVSLKVTRVSTSCGCTSAEVEKETLEPYEETTVTVSFDPAVHKNDTDLGDLTRTIYIETDNPNFSKFENTITANVVKK